MLNTLEGRRERERKRRRREGEEEKEGGVRGRGREGGILVVTAAPLKYFCLGRVTFRAGLHVLVNV